MSWTENRARARTNTLRVSNISSKKYYEYFDVNMCWRPNEISNAAAGRNTVDIPPHSGHGDGWTEMTTIFGKKSNSRELSVLSRNRRVVRSLRLS